MERRSTPQVESGWPVGSTGCLALGQFQLSILLRELLNVSEANGSATITVQNTEVVPLGLGPEESSAQTQPRCFNTDSLK